MLVNIEVNAPIEIYVLVLSSVPVIKPNGVFLHSCLLL